MTNRQTYENYHKKYYHEHKDTILERNRDRQRERSRDYYKRNRELVLERARLKRLQNKISVEEK